MIEKKIAFLFGIILAGVLGGCARRPVVLVTGYWPPTNEMLVPFSDDAAVNPDGWQGRNWKGLGYDVYAYFPTFPEGTAANPRGVGDFQVDYQDSWEDFRRITQTLRPAVIVCYGLGAGPWEIECNAVYRQYWHDDYCPPTRPTDLPLGNWRDGQTIALTLPVEAIQAAVGEALPELNVWIDRDGDPGDFLCNYMALLAADYQLHHKQCRMTGFIHAGPEVDIETARLACEITLAAILEELQ